MMIDFASADLPRKCDGLVRKLYLSGEHKLRGNVLYEIRYITLTRDEGI